jgi:hypothetical protein
MRFEVRRLVADLPWAALQNVKATKLLLGTSMALSFGELVAYGEWELLTVFARYGR